MKKLAGNLTILDMSGRWLIMVTIIMLLSVTAIAAAAPKGSHTQKPLTAVNKEMFRELDALLDSEQVITSAKEKRIATLRSTLARTHHDADVYAINAQLYEEYMAFKYDSAYRYVQRNIALARRMGDRDRLEESRLNLVHILSVTGLFEQASNTIASVDSANLNATNRIAYYRQWCDLYLFDSEFTFGTDYYNHNIRNLQEYRRKILLHAPYDVKVFYQVAYIAEMENRYTDACRMMEEYLRKSGLQSGNRDYSIATSTLAYLYQKQGDEERQVYYLLLSAISDERGAVKENNSLRELASILFDRGDYDRAYAYLNSSINDAVFYGTRLRNMQASKLIPKVVRAFNDTKKKELYRHYVLMAWLVFIAVLLIIALVLTRRYMLRYRQSNRKEKEANEKLNELISRLQCANRQLSEEKGIREQYIGRFMDVASTLIDQAESYRRELNRLARDRKMQELYTLLKSNRLLMENSRLFYQNFDDAFLNIHPHFVEQVNRLLEPDGQIQPKEERLTTELRILALMRLGISGNQKIADILRSSITTIYTYRSKLKTRARNKDNFEHQVMEIV